MVMEFVDGGDLLALLNSSKRLAEVECKDIFSQIVCGVAFCHSLGVAHRDLKPENILIELGPPHASPAAGARPRHSYRIKVADFGLSTLVPVGEFLRTACGSPHYVAPEVLVFDGSGAYGGCPADVWSMGVILYVLLCHKVALAVPAPIARPSLTHALPSWHPQLPFEADTAPELYKLIRLGLPALPATLPPRAADLLRRVVTVEPSQRPTSAEIGRDAWLNESAAMVDAGCPPGDHATLTARPSIGCSPLEVDGRDGGPAHQPLLGSSPTLARRRKVPVSRLVEALLPLHIDSDALSRILGSAQPLTPADAGAGGAPTAPRITPAPSEPDLPSLRSSSRAALVSKLTR